MDTLKVVFFGIAVPGLISLAIFAAVWFKSRQREDTKYHTWAGSLALGVAFFTGYALLNGIPAYPPAEAAMWIPWIVVSVGVLGFIDGVFKMPYSLVWLVRIVIAFGFTWQLLNEMTRQHWTGEESMRWVGWLTVGIVIIWGFCDETAWRVRGASLPIALTVAASGLCIGLYLGNAPLLFQTALILTAVTAGAILPGVRRPTFSLAAGAMPIYIMVYYSLLMCGLFYAELPMLSAAAFALAPLGPSSAMASGLNKDPWWENVVAVAGALVPVGLGLYFAYAAQLAAPASII